MLGARASNTALMKSNQADEVVDPESVKLDMDVVAPSNQGSKPVESEGS